MIDEQSVERAAERFRLPEGSFERLALRRDRKGRNQRIRAGVLGLAIAIGMGWLGVHAIQSAPPVPADDRSGGLGIFAPVAGRIVFQNDGSDFGYHRGLWAVDPAGSEDSYEGPIVDDEIASSLVQLRSVDAVPLAWSSDGTELLIMRTIGDEYEGPPARLLYILQADGSETQVTPEPMFIHSATISPDGSRVVYARWADESGTPGMYAVDAEGGRTTIVRRGDDLMAPTFSPDGTQIAYVDEVDGKDNINPVWVMGADGNDAHQIVSSDRIPPGFVYGLEWSPVGDRIALGVRRYLEDESPSAIYTFASDGSDLKRVITHAYLPYWSPDGSQIAYSVDCSRHPDGCSSVFEIVGDEDELAVSDMDGSDARAFGFATSGPWHPGT
jgi:Tol biopolymer transport system component